MSGSDIFDVSRCRRQHDSGSRRGLPRAAGRRAAAAALQGHAARALRRRPPPQHHHAAQGMCYRETTPGLYTRISTLYEDSDVKKS